MSSAGTPIHRSKNSAVRAPVDLATPDPPERKVFVRRRRSRSSDSRRSRKENTKDMVISGKKRKMAPKEEVPRSPGPSLEVIPPKAQHTRKWKPHRGRTEHRVDPEASRLASNKHRRVIPPMDEEKPNVYKLTAHGAVSPALAAPVRFAPSQQALAELDVEELIQQVIELKKEAEVAKKAAISQTQVIESLKKELAEAKRMSRKQGSQIEKLKSSGKKSDELITSIQGNLQCQICLELLLKPYALSPCGHVLCQKCLQEWFRSAPAQAHEEDEDGLIPPLYRRKSCPCCRAHIYTRPIQLFLLKSITSSLAADAPAAPADSAEPDDDPWADIFPQEVDMSDDDYCDDDDDDADIDPDAWSIDMGFSVSEHDYGYGFGSDSEGEPYMGEYIRPAWAPSMLSIPRDDAPEATHDQLRMMRRGATFGMIRRFDMRYDTGYGLVATTDEDHDVFLGWNIELDDDDEEGEDFMSWIEDDILERPERWDVQEDIRGEWVAWRLVREDNGR